MEQSKWGVHISHCCLMHGCKYGNTDCPVVNGQAVQEFTCESCDDAGIKSVTEMTRRVKLQQPGQMKMEISVEPDEKMAEQGTPYSWCVLKYREPDGWDSTEWEVTASGWSASIEQAFKEASNYVPKKVKTVDHLSEKQMLMFLLDEQIVRLCSLVDKSTAMKPSLKGSPIKTALRSVYFFFNRGGGYTDKEIRAFYYSKVEEIETQRLDAVIDYLDHLIASLPSATRSEHLPILLAVADIAMEVQIQKEDFQELVEKFFSNENPHFLKYKELLRTGGYAKEEKVQQRFDFLKKSLIK